MSKLFDDASLAMIPSAYKDGKLYSIRPTDGSGDFTFSRGSNLAATRVDVNGLIEKGRENHLLQSNNFTTTWTTAAAGTSPTLTSGQSGYNGSNDAWLLDKSAVAFSRVEQSVSLSGVWTFSVYAKAGTLDIMRLRDSSNANAAEFNLTSGTANPYGSIAQSITSVGSGWYRCSATFSGSTTQVSIYLQWSQADAGNIYIQDAQLEAGLVATDYIETGASTAQAGILEDMPRLDYSGGASCPALLLEPQRTNLFDYSEYASGNTFSNLPIVTDNYAVSPEGIQNAFRVQDTDGSNFKSIKLSAGNVIVSANSEHTISVFVKKAIASVSTYSGFSIEYTGTSNQISYIIFDEYNGTLTAIQSQSTLTLHDVKDFGDYWRFSVSGKDTGGNTEFNTRLYACLSSNGTSPSLGTKDYTAYGLQCEQGSYPTSYIPTYGSSVTRSNDSSSLGSMISNGIITDEQFTFMIHLKVLGRATNPQIYLTDIGGSRIVSLNTQRTNQVGFYSPDGAAYVSTDTFTTDSAKVALSYNGSEFVQYTNGVKTGTLSISITAVLNSIIMAYTTLNAIDIKQMSLFPTALTDSECIALTTL